MIRARTLSNVSLHRAAFLTAAAVAISTLAGCSAGPSTGDADVLSFEGLDYPSAIDVDSDGNVYITDSGTVRRQRHW
ncbi:NHL repeat-containing protein [Rhodococcus globerulus]|nr:NHL repeat-containing protein [Rhodococcus globerulus]